MNPNNEQSQPVVEKAPSQGPSMGQNNDTAIAIIAYIVFFVPLLMGQRSSFVNYHTNQGTLLFIALVAGSVVLRILMPVFGFMGNTVSMLFNLFIVALAVIGIMNVLKGATKPLPIIGGFQIIK